PRYRSICASQSPSISPEPLWRASLPMSIGKGERSSAAPEQFYPSVHAGFHVEAIGPEILRNGIARRDIADAVMLHRRGDIGHDGGGGQDVEIAAEPVRPAAVAFIGGGAIFGRCPAGRGNGQGGPVPFFHGRGRAVSRFCLTCGKRD